MSKVDQIAFKKFFSEPKKTDDKKKYIREYHQEFRKDSFNQHYYEGLDLIKRVINCKNEPSDTLMNEFTYHTNCGYSDLMSKFFNQSSPILNYYRSTKGVYEVDHIIPRKELAKPEYVHLRQYANNLTNLQLVTKYSNRSKSGKQSGSIKEAVAMASLIRTFNHDIREREARKQAEKMIKDTLEKDHLKALNIRYQQFKRDMVHEEIS